MTPNPYRVLDSYYNPLPPPERLIIKICAAFNSIDRSAGRLESEEKLRIIFERVPRDP